MSADRMERDSMGTIAVPAGKLWGAQTARSLEHFSIGDELMPRPLIPAYAILKRASAEVNHRNHRLGDEPHRLILQVCDEILDGKHDEMFPLHVWMTGSGTQFNMNVNEVIANRASQLAGEPLGSKRPVHPNDHANLSQSSNDNFPTAMHIAAAREVTATLLPAFEGLERAVAAKADAWHDIVKIGRTHLQDATPLTLGQEWSGYATMIASASHRISTALQEVYELALGGTAVGTGVNSYAGFAEQSAAEIARLTGLPFITASNKFAAQGAHDALVTLSASLRGAAVALFKIANDIRLLACGPRSGFAELILPENEPGSSIMPGKVNPTQAEALAMICLQVMANDTAVAMGGASGYLEMNVYKPLMIYNLLQSVTLLASGASHFRRFLVEGTRPNLPRLEQDVERSLMRVTALAPTIGYDRAAEIAHLASERNLTLRQAALELGYIGEEEFDRLTDPRRMLSPEAAG